MLCIKVRTRAHERSTLVVRVGEFKRVSITVSKYTDPRKCEKIFDALAAIFFIF